MEIVDRRKSQELAVADQLDRHAELLRRHEAAHAADLAARCQPDVVALMQVAARVQDALVPVAPDAAFGRELRRSLLADAKLLLRESPLERAPRRIGRSLSSLRELPVRRLTGGGVAVALLGVTAAILLRGRSRTATSPGS